MFDGLKSAIAKNKKFRKIKIINQQNGTKRNTEKDSESVDGINSIDYDEVTKKTLPSYPLLKKYSIKLNTKMGDGAFSDVYKATFLDHSKILHPSIEENTCAIKIISKVSLNNAQQLAIRNEATLLKRCNHSNIIKFIDLKEDYANYFLVTEFCNGGELFHKIVEFEYFSESLSRYCFKQIAEGLDYLHKKLGIVHRDIKPENILYNRISIIKNCDKYVEEGYDVYRGRDQEGYIVDGVGGGGIGKIKIADFGLSKVVWSNDTMTPCGTVAYAAPEIVNDEKYDISVDMWAMGCVLYTMLCGFPPFYDENIQILTEKVANGYFEFLSPWWDDISMTSKDLISRLLKRDPKKRVNTKVCMLHPWTRDNSQKVNNVDDLMRKLFSGIKISTPMTPSVTLKDAFDISYAVHRMGNNTYNPKVSNPNNPIDLFNNNIKDSKLSQIITNPLANKLSNEKGPYKLDMDKSSILVKRKNQKVLA